MSASLYASCELGAGDMQGITLEGHYVRYNDVPGILVFNFGAIAAVNECGMHQLASARVLCMDICIMADIYDATVEQ